MSDPLAVCKVCGPLNDEAAADSCPHCLECSFKVDDALCIYCHRCAACHDDDCAEGYQPAYDFKYGEWD